jgi:hypothetical protein
VTLRTRLTEKLGIRRPVLLAPMGSIAGGRLAGAVSEVGGLGLIGGGYGEKDWRTGICCRGQPTSGLRFHYLVARRTAWPARCSARPPPRRTDALVWRSTPFRQAHPGRGSHAHLSSAEPRTLFKRLMLAPRSSSHRVPRLAVTAALAPRCHWYRPSWIWWRGAPPTRWCGRRRHR